MNPRVQPSLIVTRLSAWLRRAELGVVVLILTGAGPASALIFNLNYDPDATFIAAGLTPQNVADMKVANAFAAAQFSDNFSDPIHVNIRITAVAGTGMLGHSDTSLATLTFAQLQTLTAADASSADDNTVRSAGGSLAGADPVGGIHNYLVSLAQAKALGLFADSAVTSDGTFTFGGGFNYNYDPNNRAVAGKVDFIGVAMHEMSEIMGRIGIMGVDIGIGNPSYMFMDLLHYTGAGVRGLNDGAGRFFSIDGGTTALKDFNDASANGGDLHDWASSASDTFNAFSGSEVLNAFTPVDLRNMDVIGYNLILVPEPSTAALGILGIALGSLIWRNQAFRNSPCSVAVIRG